MPNLDLEMFIKRLLLAVLLQRGFGARWQVGRTRGRFAQGRAHMQTQLQICLRVEPFPRAWLLRAMVMCHEGPDPALAAHLHMCWLNLQTLWCDLPATTCAQLAVIQQIQGVRTPRAQDLLNGYHELQITGTSSCKNAHPIPKFHCPII